MTAPALTLADACKRLLIAIIKRDAPMHERAAWVEDARRIGAFTDEDARVVAVALELEGLIDA